MSFSPDKREPRVELPSEFRNSLITRFISEHLGDLDRGSDDGENLRELTEEAWIRLSDIINKPENRLVRQLATRSTEDNLKEAIELLKVLWDQEADEAV